MTAAASEHGARAEVLHAVLQKGFWMPRQRLYRVVEGRPANPFGAWHHWWQSHALGTLLDRFERTGDPAARHQADALVEGMRRRGGGRLTNDFYDDVGWLALELDRRPGRRDDLTILLAALRSGAMPEGGVAWAVQHPEFRNTAATGPAAIVAMRVGARTGDAELAAWGLSLLGWMRDTVVDQDGNVADGFRINADGSTGIDADRYSYCYGLVVGAELAAYALTGASDHLDRALVVAAAAMREVTDPATGIWVSEGRHDRALFRGILARFLTELALASGDRWLTEVIRLQADTVWAASAGGPIGAEWRSRPEGRVELSEHVGGLLVVEAAARLP